ncbi:MAG: GGDEF domain-containing protein [Acidobacteriota bacterium]
MRLYVLLDWLLPKSYLAKVVAVAVVCGQAPSLLLLGLTARGIVPVEQMSMLILPCLAAGFLVLTLGLAAVMRPVARLERAFTSFEHGAAQNVSLPEHHRDTVGRLMAQAARMMRTAETRIDAAQKLADRDPLTGLLNRRGLERVLAAQKTERVRGAVLMIDFDHFKRVNDLLGHDAGDRVLCDFGQLIKRHLRRSDHAARFGGEEFVVYLADLGQDVALRVAERLRQSVQDGIVLDGSAQTVSIGVAPWPPGETFEAILKRADTAVYAAKNAGRNCVHLISPACVVALPASGSAYGLDVSDATNAEVTAPCDGPGLASARRQRDRFPL